MEKEDLMDVRVAAQEVKLILLGFLMDVTNHARFLRSEEDGAKSLTKRLSVATEALKLRVREFSDANTNQAVIAAAVVELKARIDDLRTLDSRLAWQAGNVTGACDAFLNFLATPMRKRPLEAQEPEPPNVERIPILNGLDELLDRMATLGNQAEGGVEERRPVIAAVNALRREIASCMAKPLDAQKTIETLRNIQRGVQQLANLRSQLTGEAGLYAALHGSNQ